MGKIAQVSSKYIIQATIETDGIVEKPDVIGAIFGQTEGLLGADLELRELQRSGRIGRIEVNIEVKAGKASGSIIIPSSLDKAETAIVGAALEIIQRIGPCNAKIFVTKIEDVRISKRHFVIERAKELLRNLSETSMPDSQELADEVAHSVRMMEVQEYGKDKLPAGPGIAESDEVIIVEGRADVLNLLKHGIKNSIAMNGTSVPQTIIDLSKEKTMIAFVDGDRGGDLNLRELLSVAEIDFVTKAPDGKEVEELTMKEIHKALRSKIASEQIRLDVATSKTANSISGQQKSQLRKTISGVTRMPPQQVARPVQAGVQPMRSAYPQRPMQQSSFQQRRPMPMSSQASGVKLPSAEEKTKFKSMLEDLIGTRGAYILDDGLNILGKVPISELASTVRSLSSGVYAIVFDGSIDKELVEVAEKSNVSYLIAMDSQVKQAETKVCILTATNL